MNKFRLKHETYRELYDTFYLRKNILLQCYFKYKIFGFIKQSKWVTIHSVNEHELNNITNKKSLMDAMINSWIAYRKNTLPDRLKTKIINSL